MSEKSTPMSIGRPQSERIAQAMALVAQGMSQYKAHKQAQCSASGLYKALKRAKANPPQVAESSALPGA